MRVHRRTVSTGFLGIAALALGSVLLAQNAPDKSDGTTAGQSTEPVYRVGKDVIPPRPIYTPNPEISPEAREAKYQATVVVMAIVSAMGNVADVKAVNPAGMGLDERAVEAVRRWKFKPASKGGKPVAVKIALEVEFRLGYRRPRGGSLSCPALCKVL
jgi:TonB family protein